jgi:predicted NUDIX family NTP pyrophosphohydrolase
MPRYSAGILLYRHGASGLQVLLAHPGGPFWARKDLGAWSIPKGEYDDSEAPLAAAQREFAEETGVTVSGPFLELTPITQRAGKVVAAWACEGDCDPTTIRSNTFTMEWPRGSGILREFPEIDRAEWFDMKEACERINPAQRGFLEELQQRL